MKSTQVEMAKHNAAVYNVEQKIEFVIGDCLQLAPHFRVDVVFLSPPWGGPQYLKERFFDLKRIIPNGCEFISYIWRPFGAHGKSLV